MAQTEVVALTEAVNGLTAEIAGLRAETLELHDYGRENRRLIRRQNRIIVGVVALAMAMGIVAVVSFKTARLAQRNANKAVTQCEVLNDEGQRQQRLWEKVISNQPPPKTPQEAAAQAAQVAQFRKDMSEAFSQQDCSKFAH